MSKLSQEEIDILRGVFAAVPTKRKRRRMTTGKRAFWLAFMLSISLIVFAGIMVWLDKDTSTVSIFGGAGVACIPIIFGIYEKASTEINLKHMEQNYNPNYDQEEGLY